MRSCIGWRRKGVEGQYLLVVDLDGYRNAEVV